MWAMTIAPPVKVAIRGEGEWVVAYVAMIDGKERNEIGRIARRLMDERKDLWEQWKALVTAGGFHIIESVTGAKVVGSVEMMPELTEYEGPEQ
jgi:hypothetical protein